jgi:fructokinase
MRSTRSAETLLRLRESRPARVFIDVNLRPPWWRRDQLADALAGADWVKLNGDELAELRPGDSDDPLPGFLRAYDLEGVVVTHGAEGAELLSTRSGRVRAEPAGQAAVVDTVGAGDAFASVMLLGLARDWPAEITLGRAQQFAARVVGQRGATAKDPGFYVEFIRAWQLDDRG